MRVHRYRAGLHEKNVCAADIFIDPNVYFAITKSRDFGLTQIDAQVLTDRFCQFGIRIPGKNF